MSETVTFVQLVVGFLLMETGVHASCPIELSPPSVVVRYGEPISVNCSTSEIHIEGIGWEATEGGMGLRKVNHLTWTVPVLTDWNISPLCYFTPSPASPFQQCSKKPEVVLYTFPENISISSSNAPDGVMTEMTEYTLECEIHNVAPVNNFTISWYQGDTNIKIQEFYNYTKEPNNVSSEIHVTPTRQNHGDTYKCVVRLDLGLKGIQLVSSQEYSLQVYFGPDVQCSAPALLEGDTLEKLCSVTGYPIPLVQWQKDGQDTDPTEPLTRKDAGLYTVSAEGFSLVVKELWVSVSSAPWLVCTSIIVALEYVPYNFPCIATGYPIPEIIWYKDGEEMEHPENLTRSHAGQFLITASNNVSTVNLTVEIIVKYPPSHIDELEDSVVDAGSTVWLNCSSMAFPPPQYTWDYYQTANVVEENKDGVSRLIIHNAAAHNIGFYTCHTWNERGNFSKTVRVTVNGFLNYSVATPKGTLKELFKQRAPSSTPK